MHMDVHASLRHLRMAPRKVRLVIDAVRGLPVLAADTRLTFMKRAAALPVQKLLRSAIANAEHNFHLKKEDLVIKTITADGGPTIRRVRPRARGSAAPIRKRTTHINIVLAVKGGAAPAASPDTKVEAPAKAKKTTSSKSVAKSSSARKTSASRAAAKTA